MLDPATVLQTVRMMALPMMEAGKTIQMRDFVRVQVCFRITGGYFADPCGFLREIADTPFWKLDRKGNVKL
jgi:hypothetical protein